MANMYRNHPRPCRFEPADLENEVREAEAKRKELIDIMKKTERMVSVLIDQYRDVLGATFTKYADQLSVAELEPIAMLNVHLSISNLTTDLDDLERSVKEASRALYDLGMTTLG